MTIDEFYKIEQKKLKNRIKILENILLNVRSKILGSLKYSSDVYYLTNLINDILENRQIDEKLIKHYKNKIG